MYTAFATVYDRLMQSVDYDGWAAYYAQMLKRRGVESGSVCECACGTGSLTVRLQRLGYAMTGVDLSQEMLSVAAAKARENGVFIPFVLQDMCRL
ncbi:MAG: class I SAM-dependent methyltransferase, partial [Clostridia bacterium]|nr:class I SAM-dependent methyltransferase [Clostridia bacterium]